MSSTLQPTRSLSQIQDLSQSLASLLMIVRTCMFVAVYPILRLRTAMGNYPNSKSGALPAGECHNLPHSGF